MFGAAHQGYPIAVNRLPVMPMHAKVQTLVAAPAEDHERAAILRQFDDTQPHLIAYLGGSSSAEDPRRNLEQPSGEVAAQPCRAGSQNHHYHGSSSE